jgi:hypothetical protein
MDFIQNNLVSTFLITFFILLCLIALFTWQSFKKYFSEFVENHIVQDYSNEPYKSINDIEVDAEIVDSVKFRHHGED